MQDFFLFSYCRYLIVLASFTEKATVLLLNCTCTFVKKISYVYFCGSISDFSICSILFYIFFSCYHFAFFVLIFLPSYGLFEYCWSFPGGLVSKESACNSGDLGSIPALGRSPGGGHGNALQYSCLESPHGQKSLAAESMRSQRVGHD